MENMFRLSNGQATAKRLKTDSEDYKACANECITLHLFDPSTSSSWPPSGVTGSFKPEFTHQIFGDDEEIVGYKGLAVDIYFSQADFQACVEIAFEDKAFGATDILSTLQEHFPGGLTSDKQQLLTVATKQVGVSLQKLGSPLSISGVRKSLSVTQANLAGGSQELKVTTLIDTCLLDLQGISLSFQLCCRDKGVYPCRTCMNGCNHFYFSSSMEQALLMLMTQSGSCFLPLSIKQTKMLW